MKFDLKELQDATYKIIREEASKLYICDGKSYSPGFSTRVKACTLNRLFEEYNCRAQEHVIAVDKAWKQYLSSIKHVKH